MKLLLAVLLLSGLVSMEAFAASPDFEKKVEHGYADSNGVKIHYASIGKGPLILMIHGFPDFWYTWRDQMEALSPNYQVVAIDRKSTRLNSSHLGISYAVFC